MITDEDIEFHPFPDNQASIWAETNYFPFFLPDSGLSGAIYNVFRPGLGVCLSDVTIFDHCSNHWEGLAYIDNQQHLPCPDSLTKYSLNNGVSVQSHKNIRHYQFEYQGIDQTSFEATFTGLMPPYEIKKPKKSSQQKDDGWIKSFGGHFDLTGHVSGQLTLRGQRHDIDCLATMDHSWGPRAERDNGSATFFQAHFGDDLSINAFLVLDPADLTQSGPLLNGYVMDRKSVTSLESASARIQRSGIFPDYFEVTLQDKNGLVYNLCGRFLTWAPWAPFSSTIYYQGLTEFKLNGQTGFGAYQEVISRAAITRHKLSIGSVRS